MNAPSLVDPDRYTGTVTYVGALLVQANLPQATARRERRRLSRGRSESSSFSNASNTSCSAASSRSVCPTSSA